MSANNWKVCPSFTDYEVSEFGDVRRCRRTQYRPITGKLLNPVKCWTGYFRYHLCLDGKPFKVKRSRLVAEAFLGAKPFEGACVCHNDGSRSNDHYSNLRWDTAAANMADKQVHGTHQAGESHGMASLNDDDVNEIRKLALAGEKGTRLAKKFNVHSSTIYRVVLGKNWKHVA
jgi:hypothetical protein